MLCHRCEEPARAVCRFCGAALCPAHTGQARFVSGWLDGGKPQMGMFARQHSDLIVVPDAKWCGACHIEAHQQ